MIRTQIQLKDDQAASLRELSSATRQSVAALIREAVDQFLANAKPNRSALYRQATSLIGKFKADANDISIEHDRYLEETFKS